MGTGCMAESLACSFGMRGCIACKLGGSLNSCHAEIHEDIWMQYSLLIRLEGVRLMVFIISTRKAPDCLKVHGHFVC